jgi:hypothetical protein
MIKDQPFAWLPEARLRKIAVGPAIEVTTRLIRGFIRSPYTLPL